MHHAQASRRSSRSSTHSVPFRSTPFHSIPFHSIPFHSILFHSVPFRSIPGKSTLVKILNGELPPRGGDVRQHSHLKMCKFTQHFEVGLRDDNNPVYHIPDGFCCLFPNSEERFGDDWEVGRRDDNIVYHIPDGFFWGVAPSSQSITAGGTAPYEDETRDGPVSRDDGAAPSPNAKDLLDFSMTPLEWIMMEYPDLTREDARKWLGRYGTTGGPQMQRLAQLSEGQKAKVVFAYMARQNAHILLLDEPTNALDMEARRRAAAGRGSCDGRATAGRRSGSSAVGRRRLSGESQRAALSPRSLSSPAMGHDVPWHDVVRCGIAWRGAMWHDVASCSSDDRLARDGAEGVRGRRHPRLARHAPHLAGGAARRAPRMRVVLACRVCGAVT